MKKKSHLLLLVSAICALFCPQAQGQPYYNFAMGTELPSTYNPCHAVIRTIDAQSAVAYYGGPGVAVSKLLYINLNPFIIAGLELTGGYDEIKDIRIENGVVFFCGRNSQTYKGFIGHVKLSDLAGSVPGSIICSNVDIPGVQSIMWRLAAYDDGTGITRVVSIGNAWFHSSPYFYTCSATTCQSTFVVECKYDAITNLMSSVGMKVVGVDTRFERADDVVVTDHWLAIVSNYPAQSQLIIHRCSKNNVLATFNNYYAYTVPYLEGVNHCCLMRGDTIADATLYCTNGGAPYGSSLRVFDLNTMTMTCAQRFDLLDKAEPLEMAYLPEYATLVTLQWQMYPSGQKHYNFVSWRPYDSTPYYAKLTYETADHKLECMDKLTTKHVVATGGDYWLMKDIINDIPSTTCYTIAQQSVDALQPSQPVYGSNNYSAYTLILQRNSYGSPIPVYLNKGCITP